MVCGFEDKSFYLPMRENKRVMVKSGRRFGGAALGKLGFCTSWAVDVPGSKKRWLEIVKVDLQLPNPAEEFNGKRIVHISDLHYSATVSGKYLRGCVERVNQLDADIVILTGDYITHDYRGRYRKKLADVICSIESRLGVYACLGNHDYGIGGTFGRFRDDKVCQIIELMETSGATVLRNESAAVEMDGQKLWFVGLGDLWAKDFKPEKAFADVGAGEAVITLAHNPAAIEHLDEFDFDVVMCGHTHGNPLDWRGSLTNSGIDRYFHYAGMYEVGNRKLYVNRGLGRLGRAFFNTRPEITVFNLQA